MTRQSMTAEETNFCRIFVQMHPHRRWLYQAQAERREESKRCCEQQNKRNSSDDIIFEPMYRDDISPIND
jgi:hypothetical protein